MSDNFNKNPDAWSFNGGEFVNKLTQFPFFFGGRGGVRGEAKGLWAINVNN